MKSFTYWSPTRYMFGPHAEEDTGELIRQNGGSSALVVSGGKSANRSGLLDGIRASLERSSITWTDYSGVQPNPQRPQVREAIALARDRGVDFVLGVGGGSAIDLAKTVAAGVPYSGDIWDFFDGVTPAQALPIGAVLTLAGSGTEASPNAIITNETTRVKGAAEADCLRPAFAIMNPRLTMTLPPFHTACGVTDMISHSFERYFTNTPRVETSDRLLEGILAGMVELGRRVMREPGDYETRANIMWAAAIGHSDILGVDRQQDWNSHHLEHVLSSVYDCAHGAGLAVVMPAWMDYVLEHHEPSRLAQIATRVWGVPANYLNPHETARAGIQAFRDFLRELGMPATLEELGAPVEDIDLLVELNHVPASGTSGYVSLDRNAHDWIYRRCAGLV